MYKRESLIIFDEIQKFPKAREAIKYLVADGRYDYIATGSLISIKENVEDITIPSEERSIKMYPLDFEEFATYMDEELLLEYIKECYENRVPLDRSMHEKALRLFKEYILVGGMPQAVLAYKHNSRDFAAADVEKRDILNLYRNDIKKAAKILDKDHYGMKKVKERILEFFAVKNLTGGVKGQILCQRYLLRL